MSFLPTEEQKALIEMVRRFGKEHINPVIQDYEERGEFPKEIFDELSALSLMGMMTPEKYGGSGLDFLTYTHVIEEIAKYSLSIAVGLSVTGLPQVILNRFGSEEQKKTYLSDLASGKKIGAFSLTETSSGSDAAALETRAEKKGNYFKYHK